jgi:hypothetical protein
MDNSLANLVQSYQIYFDNGPYSKYDGPKCIFYLTHLCIRLSDRCYLSTEPTMDIAVYRTIFRVVVEITI